MLTKDHISFQLQKYKAEQKLSLDTMAQAVQLFLAMVSLFN